MDQFQKARVAVLVADVATRAALVRLVIGSGTLRRFLGSFPGGPGFALDAIDLLEFQVAGRIKVTHGRFTPLGPDLPEIVGDRGLSAG